MNVQVTLDISNRAENIETRVICWSREAECDFLSKRETMAITPFFIATLVVPVKYLSRPYRRFEALAPDLARK